MTLKVCGSPFGVFLLNIANKVIYHFKVAHDTYSAGYYGNKSSGHRKIEKRFARGNLHGSQAG